MTDLVRSPAWGNARMFAAFDPDTNEILAFSRTIGKTRNGPGLAQKAAELGQNYVIHEFARLRTGEGEENNGGDEWRLE